MSNNSPLSAPTLQPPRFHLQPFNSMERAPDLEGADALQVLALEVQTHPRVCRLLHLLLAKRYTHRSRSSTRSDAIKRGIPERRRVMHKLSDQLPRLEH